MFNIKNLIICSVVLVAGLLQSSCLHFIAVLGIKPDILSIVIVFITLFIGKESALKAAIVAGLFKDVTSSALFGSHVFSLFLSVLILVYFSGHIFKQKILMQVVICSLFYLLSTLIVLLLNSIIPGGSGAGLGVYFPLLLKASFYTGIIAPPLFLVSKQIFKPYFLYI